MLKGSGSPLRDEGVPVVGASMTRGARLALWVAAPGWGSAAVLLVLPSPPLSNRTLEVELRASAGTEARLLWSADQHWTEQESYRLRVHPTTEGFERLRFPLPQEGVPWIRLEPTNAEADV